MEGFTPVRRTTLSDVITSRLVDLIAQGDLKTGDQIPTELELAQMFEVGRTTIREALKALSATGVVERTRRGTFVREPEPIANNTIRLAVREANIRDVYEARLVLEVALAERAAERATAEEIQQLKQTAAELEAVDPSDAHAVFEADMAFHYRLAELADNPLLHEMLVAARSRIFQELREAALSAEVVQHSIDNHLRLIVAIEQGNARLAGEIVRESLRDAESEFLRFISTHPDENLDP